MTEEVLDPAPVATATPRSADGDWHRLDPRMLAVRPARELLNFAIPLIVLFVTGSGGDENGPHWTRYIGYAATGLLILRGMLHWFTTKYRIGRDQVELHTGLLVRKQLAVPRDRIRTVDAKSDFLHRIFGLADLRIGTGRQSGHTKHKDRKEDGLALSSVSVVEADRLRQLLLHRAAAATTFGAEPSGAPAVVAEPETITKLDRAWLRFAPFTLSGLAAVGALLGFGWRITSELHLAPQRIGVVRSAINEAYTAPVWLLVLLGAVVLVLVAGLGSVVVYVFAYSNFRLTREHGGSLRVQRGLLTTRSDSIEVARLRGVELIEPLLLRMVGGARTAAVVGGAACKPILPPAPLAEANRVGADVLDLPAPPTAATLTRHPRRALPRRLTRALAPVVLLTAGLAVAAADGDLPEWPWQASMLLLPLVALLAVDRYRALGHALTAGSPGYLVSRTGSLTRKTPALRTTGIIGWRIRRTVFQRRAGLVTLAATAGISAGEYRVVDVTEGDGLALAEAATPGLLTPFLVDVPPGR